MSGIQLIAGKYTRERAVGEIAQNELWPYSLSARAGSTYPFHHHETDETVYLIEGELLFTEEETDRQYSVRAGDKLFIPARQGHTVKAIANATYIMALKNFIALEEFPVWHEPVDRQTFFDTLAHQFAEAEQYPAEMRDYSATLSCQLERSPESGEQFYKRVLAQGLRFRRAGGPPAVDTATFLKGLTNPDNRTDKIAVSDVEVIEYSRDLVLTALVVTLTGRRGGNEINGKQYRNVRIFTRDPGEWRCVLWFNTPL